MAFYAFRKYDMTSVLTPDICVIGAGSGGLSVAAAAAAFGVPVVLIEKGKMGGDCLNYGCVPSKSLIAAANRVEIMTHSRALGVSADSVTILPEAVHDHIHKVIAAIAPNDSRERFAGLGVQVIEGAARFKNKDTVAVGDVEIKARRFVIATGSSPAVPSIRGLAETPHLTNETVFDLAETPQHLIVIGAGPIGLELAQAWRRLGAKVTVVEALTPLAKDDPECAAIVLEHLAHDGVTIRAGVNVVAVTGTRGKVTLALASPAGGETITGTHLLVAAGRKANVDDLDLDAAGITHDKHGIVVDKGLRTSNRRVYAIGDVAGALQFTHVANYHAGLVIRNALFRMPVKVKHDIVPWVTFTDPELAQVGLTEAEAVKRGHEIRVLRWPYHENDRAQTERKVHGHIKAITTKRGRILGATIVGADAGELIALWALALAQGLNIRALTGMVVPYPTLGEISKRAAITFFTPGLTSPFVRRIIALLRRFG